MTWGCGRNDSVAALPLWIPAFPGVTWVVRTFQRTHNHVFRTRHAQKGPIHAHLHREKTSKTYAANAEPTQGGGTSPTNNKATNHTLAATKQQSTPTATTNAGKQPTTNGFPSFRQSNKLRNTPKIAGKPTIDNNKLNNNTWRCITNRSGATALGKQTTSATAARERSKRCRRCAA